jgi:hypothetical protein
MQTKTIEDLDALREECRAMVTKRAGLSAGAAMIPVFGMDAMTDVALLLDMIPAINRKFGLTPEQIDQLDPQIKKLLFVAITAVGSDLIGRVVTKTMIMRLLTRVGIGISTQSLAKFIPILGQALSAAISFGAMKMLGNAHIDDCYEIAKKLIHPDALSHPAPNSPS